MDGARPSSLRPRPRMKAHTSACWWRLKARASEDRLGRAVAPLLSSAALSLIPLLNVRRLIVAPSHPDRFTSPVPYHHHHPPVCAHPTTFRCNLPPLLIVEFPLAAGYRRRRRRCRHHHRAVALPPPQPSCRHCHRCLHHRRTRNCHRRRQAAAHKLPPLPPSRCRPAVNAAAIPASVALPLHPSCCCHRQHHVELAPQRFRRCQATATATTLPPLPPCCCHRRQAATTTLPPPRRTYRHRRELDGGGGIGGGSIKGVARCGRRAMSSAEDLLGVIF